MNDRNEARERLLMVLRDTVLADSDRDVPEGSPLGEAGIGLDSLALVEFLTAVEREFATEVPIEIWSDIAHLSLDDCAAALGPLRC